MERQQRLLAWEQCLTALIKLIKAVGYYPPGHPALHSAGEQALLQFLPLLEEGSSLQCTIRREGIQVDGMTVGEKNPHLKKLAGYLFIRRLQSLTILPDLSARDLTCFAGCLTPTPEELQRQGGVAELLLRRRVTGIWTNELDLSAILTKREELLAQPPEPGEEGEQGEEALSEPEAGPQAPATEPQPQPSLVELLGELAAKPGSDHRFGEILGKIPGLLKPELALPNNPLALHTFRLLQGAAGDPALSNARRRTLTQTLDRLLDEESLDFLTSLLCDRSLPSSQREQGAQALLFYQGQVSSALMNRLSAETDAQARKTISELLVRQGSIALPVMLEQLRDSRWYVVRNAVAILGEIRDPAATGPLRSLLTHEDLRVRRETVRALTRIGGQGATGILLQLLEGADAELSEQALLSLGAMKNPAAVPALLRLALEEGVQRPTELRRGAIKALGEIGSAEAAPPLIELLASRRFWRPGRHNELRAAAAAALGEIGDPAALTALESAASERNETVARAAVQALKQLRR